jgi:hypothetical protein
MQSDRLTEYLSIQWAAAFRPAPARQTCGAVGQRCVQRQLQFGFWGGAYQEDIELDRLIFRIGLFNFSESIEVCSRCPGSTRRSRARLLAAFSHPSASSPRQTHLR